VTGRPLNRARNNRCCGSILQIRPAGCARRRQNRRARYEAPA
jgi:hypothetical protein